MPATNKNLIRALTSSIRAWVPNIRLRPDKGLSLFGLKPTALVENSHPPISAGVTKASTKVKSKNGITAKIPCTKRLRSTLGKRCVSINKARSMVNASVSISVILLMMESPVNNKNAAPKTMIIAMDSSFERGT